MTLFEVNYQGSQLLSFVGPPAPISQARFLEPYRMEGRVLQGPLTESKVTNIYPSFGIPKAGPDLGVIPRSNWTPSVPGATYPFYQAPASQSENPLMRNPKLFSRGGSSMFEMDSSYSKTASRRNRSSPQMSGSYASHSSMYQIGDALTTGAVFVGADMLLNKQSFDLKKGLWSAGSEFAAEWIEPSVYANFPSLSSAQMVLCPALSGAFYVLFDMLAKYDGRSALYKFLLQGGSSLVGGKVLYPPIARSFNVA